MTYDEYLNKGKLCINYPYYTDNKGNLMVDRVVKYETLASELQQVFDMLGVEFDGNLAVRAKSEHRIDKRAYREVLTDRQQELIRDAFAKEIEMHGYAF